MKDLRIIVNNFNKVSNDDIVITGDMNFHLDNLINSEANIFLDQLTGHKLVQHIRSATHVCGHIHDVVKTTEVSKTLSETAIVTEREIHYVTTVH